MIALKVIGILIASVIGVAVLLTMVAVCTKIVCWIYENLIDFF